MGWTIQRIEQTFLDYMVRRGHVVIGGHSLRSPTDDVLFTTAGMHPLVPYLSGQAVHPAGRRLTDVQRCVRTTDIDEVGDDAHLTVFEMLGNWSLGEYFKETSIPQSFGLLTGEFGIDPHSLYVTVFAGDAEVPADDESPEIGRQTFADAGVDPTGRINPQVEDNWWSNGPVREPEPGFCPSRSARCGRNRRTDPVACLGWGGGVSPVRPGTAAGSTRCDVWCFPATTGTEHRRGGERRPVRGPRQDGLADGARVLAGPSRLPTPARRRLPGRLRLGLQPVRRPVRRTGAATGGPVPACRRFPPARRPCSTCATRTASPAASPRCGMVLSAAVVGGLVERLPLGAAMAVWLALWVLYLSFVNVGQIFFGFVWETLLLGGRLPRHVPRDERTSPRCGRPCWRCAGCCCGSSSAPA